MGAKEKKLEKEVLLQLTPNQRRFRINAGRGWASEEITWQKIGNDKYATLKNPRTLNAAPAGWPDLCGWDSVEITEDMVGTTVAVFVGEELKTGRLQLSKIQKKFRDCLTRMGGIFRVIRD